MTETFLELDQKTKTGRFYSTEIVDAAIKKYRDKQLLVITNSDFDSINVDLSNVCGHVSELLIEDSKLTGTVEVSNTPMGKVIKSLIEEGVELGFSPRGIGILTKKDDYFVVSDYELISISVHPKEPQ